LGVVFRLAEMLEHLALTLGRNANAGVLHRKQNTWVLPLHTQNDRALVRELQRIAQEVDQNLHQPVPIGADPDGQVVVQLHAVINVHAFHARLKQLKGMRDRLAQFKAFWLNQQFTRFQL
jgi:hypothetical protein